MKVFDLHCDTLSELRYAEKAGAPKSFAENDLHIDLQKLKKGDYMLQCFAAFVNLGDKTPGADPLVTALEEIDVFKRIMEKYPEDIAPVSYTHLRLSPCKRLCANISGTATAGCGRWTVTAWAASSPTIWAWARRCRC